MLRNYPLWLGATLTALLLACASWGLAQDSCRRGHSCKEPLEAIEDEEFYGSEEYQSSECPSYYWYYDEEELLEDDEAMWPGKREDSWMEQLKGW